MKSMKGKQRLLLAAILCFIQTNLWAVTEVNVETAGTLSELLTSTERQLKVTGFINGSDIKFLREKINAGAVTSLDLEGVRIVSGGEAYTENFTTQNDIIGEQMFYKCSKLVTMVLPNTVTSIKKNAFANTGIKKIDIPNSVLSVEEDAFAYCNSLATVVVGKKVKSLSKGVFYNSPVKDVYVKALTPPSLSDYIFNSNPTIHVYESALAKYQSSSWAKFGTIVGDLTDDIIDAIKPPSISPEGERTEVSPRGDLEGVVFDLLGRKVTDLKSGSIYIRNGKKFMVK